jgi:purine nucleosidase
MPLPAADQPQLNLIIDCDPGIDDALALWLAAAAPEQVNLLGVTCVSGNRPVHTTGPNARKLLDAAGRADVPVYAGADQPLVLPAARSNLVHGGDGLGGVVFAPARPLEAEHAVDYLVRTIGGSSAGSITLMAVGPLTNLALAEQRQPGLLGRLARLLIMGGAVEHPGNVTPRAEFNFHADPHAAAQVLAATQGAEIYGLDVTSKVSMPAEWIESLATRQTTCGRAARDMLRSYAVVDALLHDACPMARLLDHGLFSGAPWALDVVCEAGEFEGAVRGRAWAAGQAVWAAGVHQVMFDVDADRLLALVAERIAALP